MNTFKWMVVATDFSAGGNNAAARAAMLASQHGTALTLIHVVSAHGLATLREWLPHGAAHSAGTELIGQAKRTLAELAEELQRKHGCAIEHRVEIGVVMDVVLAAAQKADLLVLGAYGRRTLSSRVLGTTAQRLLATSTTPMLVVRQAPDARYRAPLVPVDFSDHSNSALRLALRVAPDAPITVFHAYQVPLEGRLRSAGVTEKALDEDRERARREAYASLAALMSQHANPKLSGRAVHGFPQTLVVEEACARGVDLIVMGKQGKSQLADFFLGSVTRHVLADAICDVLVVPAVPSDASSSASREA